MAEQSTGLRLLTRPECGLCEDMARDLQEIGLPFATIDIEQDGALERAYGEVIPVLMHGETEIARAPQTLASLKQSLQRAGLLPWKTRRG